MFSTLQVRFADSICQNICKSEILQQFLHGDLWTTVWDLRSQIQEKSSICYDIPALRIFLSKLLCPFPYLWGGVEPALLTQWNGLGLRPYKWFSKFPSFFLTYSSSSWRLASSNIFSLGSPGLITSVILMSKRGVGRAELVQKFTRFLVFSFQYFKLISVHYGFNWNLLKDTILYHLPLWHWPFVPQVRRLHKDQFCCFVFHRTVETDL